MRKIDANDSPVRFLLSRLTKFSRFFFIMAEAHTCLNLANFHVVVWWSKYGPAYVAKELLSFKDRCPADLKENGLQGFTLNFFFIININLALKPTAFARLAFSKAVHCPGDHLKCNFFIPNL